LCGGEPGDWHAVGGATHVVEPDAIVLLIAYATTMTIIALYG